jgi:hypothetical protein
MYVCLCVLICASVRFCDLIEFALAESPRYNHRYV